MQNKYKTKESIIVAFFRIACQFFQQISTIYLSRASTPHMSTILFSFLSTTLLGELFFLQKLLCNHLLQPSSPSVLKKISNPYLQHSSLLFLFQYFSTAQRLCLLQQPVANLLATELFMRRECRRLQARHIWKDIDPDWPWLKKRVWTRSATGLPQACRVRSCTSNSSSMIFHKHQGGWKRSIKFLTHIESNGNGSVAILRKLLHNFRARGLHPKSLPP